MGSQTEEDHQEEPHTFRDKKAYFQKIGGCQATICTMVHAFKKLQHFYCQLSFVYVTSNFSGLVAVS